MRWQQLLSLSLVMATGLIGCARQTASKLNMDIDQKGDVSNVQYDPSKEMTESYGVRAATETGKARGILDSTGYYGTDSVLLQLMNNLQPYSHMASHLAGVTLSSDNFNNIWAQYCQVNPAYCYGNDYNQIPVRVTFKFTVAGGSAPKLYRYFFARNEYAGYVTAGTSQAIMQEIMRRSICNYNTYNYNNFNSDGSCIENWTVTADQKSTEVTARIVRGSSFSFYQAVGVGTTNLTAAMTVTPLSGATTPGSGSKDVSPLMAQANSWPSMYVSQVNVDSLTVTPSGTSSGTTASIKVGRLTPQVVCYAIGCISGQY